MSGTGNSRRAQRWTATFTLKKRGPRSRKLRKWMFKMNQMINTPEYKAKMQKAYEELVLYGHTVLDGREYFS